VAVEGGFAGQRTAVDRGTTIAGGTVVAGSRFARRHSPIVEVTEAGSYKTETAAVEASA